MTINEQQGKLRYEKTNPIQWLYDKLFLLPAVCPVCMERQERLGICDKCRTIALRKRSLYGQCARCGSFGVCSAACRNCREWPAYYKGNIVIWPYQEVYKQIIKEFKFYDMPWLAEVLAQEMMPYLPHGYDLLVPVPLHPNRLHERGYNQSELLTRALSRYSGIPWQHSLKRVRDTPHQTGLNREERQHNLHNAFSLKGTDTVIRGKRIILIDDVFTTGSTLLSCAKVLHQHGAKEITSCTLASGQARF